MQLLGAVRAMTVPSGTLTAKLVSLQSWTPRLSGSCKWYDLDVSVDYWEIPTVPSDWRVPYKPVLIPDIVNRVALGSASMTSKLIIISQWHHSRSKVWERSTFMKVIEVPVPPRILGFLGVLDLWESWSQRRRVWGWGGQESKETNVSLVLIVSQAWH